MHRATHANRARILRIRSGLSALVILLAGCDVLTPQEQEPDGCQSHAECSDSLPCTSDRCGSDGSCTNLVSGDWCLIQGQCVAGKAVKPGNACEVCTPLISARAWSAVPDGTSCDDAVGCTFNDTCSVGACAGTTYSCDDKLACTIDSCTGLTPLATKGCKHDVKAGACLIAGACHSTGTKNTGNSCDRCDPAASKTTWSAVACCGDGSRDSGEQCDLSDLNGMTCAKLGFASGGLTCKSDCTFDRSACAGGSGGGCGNGALDYGEACDGAKLSGVTCVKLGYASGSLKCASSCTYDVAACVKPAGCGDGKLGSGEQCDGAKLGGKTCVALGFTGGTLGCLPSCSFDYSLCSQCGNNVREAGEQCDGPVTGATCITRGLNAGVLGCDVKSCTFDTSGCGWALGVGDKAASISDVATDASGNVYVAGNFSGSVTLGSIPYKGQGTNNLFVAKLDPAGNVLWSVVGKGAAEARAIAVSGGNVYLTGWAHGGVSLGSINLSGGQTYKEVLVAQINANNGYVKWGKLLGGTGNKAGNGVAVSGAGEIFVVGDFWTLMPKPGAKLVFSKGSSDIFILKLDSSGQHLATKTYGSSGLDSGADVLADALGNVWVTGHYSAAVTSPVWLAKPRGGTDVLLLRLSAALVLKSARSAGSNGNDQGKRIARSGTTLYLSGTMQGDLYIPHGQMLGVTIKIPCKGSGSDRDAFVIAFPQVQTGMLWPMNWGVVAGGSGDEFAAGLIMGAAGNIYLTGTLGSSSVAFGSATLTSTLGRAFVARLDPSKKAFDWATNFGGSSGAGHGVAAGPLGNVYAVGSFLPGTAGVAFGASTLKSNRTYILKIAKP